MERGIVLYDPQQHRGHAALYGQDTGAACLGFAAFALGLLGYPEQARQRAHEALTLAQELAHPYTLAWAFSFAMIVHYLRREWPQTRQRAEAAIAMSSEHGFPFWVGAGKCFHGRALMQEGHVHEAITQIHQGLGVLQVTGTEMALTYLMTMLAEAYGKNGQHAAGLSVLDKALTLVNAHGERFWEAEIYRLKGELLLQSGGAGRELRGFTPLTKAAEACFRQALDVARRQQARTLELRAAMSLGRLWQSQERCDAARQLLADIYGWFTEGFDTADLQDARALLDART
jgi:adenylate cyclase